MTDHQKAIAKLRDRLFKARTPEQYGLDSATEIIIPPYQPERIGSSGHLGGLGYHILNRPGQRLEISHRHGNDFVIFTFWILRSNSCRVPKERSYLAVDAHWKTLESDLERVLTLIPETCDL